MSYILDALKKAAEQRGESAPGFRRLVMTPPAPEHRRLVWAGAGIVAVCAIAAGATAFVTLRSAPVIPAAVATTPPVVARAPAQAPRTSAPTTRPPAVAPPAPRVVAPLISIPPVAEPPRAVPATRAPSVVVAPRADPPAATPAPMPSAPPEPAATGQPKLKLEVLVYSDVASERMVFINGRKYVQGDTVAEHARVEEIQADGVVLSEQGRRFTLRQ